MRIRITDIPPEGRELDFDLDAGSLNERASLVKVQADDDAVPPPSYTFTRDPRTLLRLSLEGSTVTIKGITTAGYVTPCSRCAEDTEKTIDVPIEMVLKPFSQRRPEHEQGEDLHFGFYEGQEVDCGSFVEELLLLALPFSVLCRADCLGLCVHCGANLNCGNCSCENDDFGDDRLKVLKTLKIN